MHVTKLFYKYHFCKNLSLIMLFSKVQIDLLEKIPQFMEVNSSNLTCNFYGARNHSNEISEKNDFFTAICYLRAQQQFTRKRIC